MARLCWEANYYLGEDVKQAINTAYLSEESPVGKEILGQLLENASIASASEVPICQDTGFAVVFLEIGQDVHITGEYLYSAVHEGVRVGYMEGYLRKSIVGDPLERINTGDNTPAVIHTTIIPGDKIKITVAPKGGGSENMSTLKMLKPADGVTGVKKFVLDTVLAAGSNACPPLVVGVGIGGTMEMAALLAKKALIRPICQRNSHTQLAALEEELLLLVNNSGIGPQGLGGRTTALAVQIETYAAHIASLPVAVNLNCHVARHKSTEL